jgi:hypothetical protein
MVELVRETKVRRENDGVTDRHFLEITQKNGRGRVPVDFDELQQLKESVDHAIAHASGNGLLAGKKRKIMNEIGGCFLEWIKTRVTKESITAMNKGVHDYRTLEQFVKKEYADSHPLNSFEYLLDSQIERVFSLYVENYELLKDVLID